MDEQPETSLQIRFFVACPRSGSTLLMRIFAESSICAVTSRLILTGKAGTTGAFTPDYSILENPVDHNVVNHAKTLGKRFLISKEELGNRTQKGECLYQIFPTVLAHKMVRPVFLVRDPIRVYDSWKNVGWTEVQSLIDCYNNMYRMLHQTPSPAVSCLVYERLIAEPETELKRICSRWGLPFSRSMLEFKQPFGSAFIFSSDRERSKYCEDKPPGLFSTVERNSTVEADVPYHGLLSIAEKDTIEEALGRQYLQYLQDDVLRLRAILNEKSWFGFDLDDTLHQFRRASGAATDCVLVEISQQYQVALTALKDEYQKILKENTANAFVDGKSSFDYRRERFISLLTRFDLPTDEPYLERLLQIYESTLAASYELNNGAISLLSLIKRLGKKIVVMTEGPQDAQERTVRALGLDSYIDFLATTNQFRASKIDGLFAKVLEHLGVSPGDVAFVGDNFQRDMEPAMAEGMFAIHFAETKNISLAAFPPRINTLRKLQYILEEDRPD